jgi:hypothetical protein
MSDQPVIECTIHFRRGGRGARKQLGEGQELTPSPKAEQAPRIARLMALAIHFDGLVRSGEIANYATLARLGRVSRARVTQIMNLLQLAPDIQEEVLFLSVGQGEREPICIRDLQPIALTLDWQKQRQLWARLRGRWPQRANENEASREASS